MRNVELITAIAAEETGRYNDGSGTFVLDDGDPETYRGGIWLIPASGANAEWYAGTDIGMSELIRRISS